MKKRNFIHWKKSFNLIQAKKKKAKQKNKAKVTYMKSNLFAILTLGLCLARAAHVYLPKEYALPEGVESYTAQQVDDVLARVVGSEPQDPESYGVLPVSREYTSLIGAGSKAVSSVLLLVSAGSKRAEALAQFATVAPLSSDYLAPQKRANSMPATVISQGGVRRKFTNIQEMAASKQSTAQSLETLQTRCNVAKELSITADGKSVAFKGTPLFDAANEHVMAVFQELSNICVFVSDEASRPATDLTVVDELFEMLDLALTEEQKKAIAEQKAKLIDLILEAAAQGKIKLVGVEIDNDAAVRVARDVADDVNDDVAVSSSSSEHKKKRDKHGLLPSAADLPQKQIFIWTGILLVITMAVVFIMMLGVGVDCERDTLLSRMVSL